MGAQAQTEKKKLDRKLQLKTLYIKKVLLNRFYPPHPPTLKTSERSCAASQTVTK